MPFDHAVHRGDDEDGAVAIIVAILLIVLLGISAFAVDFGLAYTTKRQIQTAADAAVIAAASTYVDATGTCGELVDDTTPAGAALRADARSRAEAITTQNAPGAEPILAEFDVQCSSTGGVEVTWATTEASPRGLGGVWGQGDIVTERRATASLEVPGGVVEGLRPYFMCSLDLPNPDGPYPTKVMRIGGVTNGSDYAPGCPEPSGNWWTINCPEDLGSNSDSSLRTAIQYGCQYPVEVVENPVPAPPDDDGLEAACPPISPASATIADDCLEANPGNITTQQAARWDIVMNRDDLVILPVFCGGNTCTPDPAIIGSGGNNAEYPIYAFAAMRVCGYHFGNKQNVRTTGTCANNPDGLTVTPGGSQSHYMLATFERVQVSGSVSPSGCSLGDDNCDGGLRQVFLTS